MEQIDITKFNTKAITSKIIRILQEGGIALLPFDTVYGLIADPYNNDALERTITLKNRDKAKTIGLAIADLNQMDSIAQITSMDFIADKVPGRHTFILNAKEKDFSPYCYRKHTLGIRIPQNSLILEICQRFGPIAQTSANKAGESDCLSIAEINKQFSQTELQSINLIVDGGTIEDGGPSQIWDLTGSEPKKIER
jgi:L-threonylcarbamoyladenylate synthase